MDHAGPAPWKRKKKCEVCVGTACRVLMQEQTGIQETSFDRTCRSSGVVGTSECDISRTEGYPSLQAAQSSQQVLLIGRRAVKAEIDRSHSSSRSIGISSIGSG